MPTSKTAPRIQRKENPPRYYSSHRKYLPYLLRDFEERCAYSMQHVERAGGIGAMDIDHHNPRLPADRRNRYENLFLSTRHCNGKKGSAPDKHDRKAGLRFLNPCEERDYDEQIFEDPDTFELWGTTSVARFHIRVLDLNATHLVRERRRRHILRGGLAIDSVSAIAKAGGEPADQLEALCEIVKEVCFMIPAISQRKKPPATWGAPAR